MGGGATAWGLELVKLGESAHRIWPRGAPPLLQGADQPLRGPRGREEGHGEEGREGREVGGGTEGERGSAREREREGERARAREERSRIPRRAAVRSAGARRPDATPPRCPQLAIPIPSVTDVTASVTDVTASVTDVAASPLATAEGGAPGSPAPPPPPPPLSAGGSRPRGRWRRHRRAWRKGCRPGRRWRICW